MIRIEETTVIHAPIERCFDLSRSVEVHLHSNVHSGEQALALGGVTSGLVGMSEQVTWRAKHFGLWQNPDEQDDRSEITLLLPSDDGSRHLPLHAGRSPVSVSSIRRD